MKTILALSILFFLIALPALGELTTQDLKKIRQIVKESETTVLDVYEYPEDPAYPVVAMDERPVQLLDDLRAPMPAKPGRIARRDYEYKRNGSVTAFMWTAPFQGWRHVSVRERHTAIDWAEVERLLGQWFPHYRQMEKKSFIHRKLMGIYKSSKLMWTAAFGLN